MSFSTLWYYLDPIFWIMGQIGPPLVVILYAIIFYIACRRWLDRHPAPEPVTDPNVRFHDRTDTIIVPTIIIFLFTLPVIVNLFGIK